MQRSGFDPRRYQIFWEVVSLKRGPLSLVSTIEELLGRKSSGSCLERREYCRRGPSCWPRGTLCLQKLGLTSLTSGGRSVIIVRSRTRTTVFFMFLRSSCFICNCILCVWSVIAFDEGVTVWTADPSVWRNVSTQEEWKDITFLLNFWFS
jgi:hypothetical protein